MKTLIYDNECPLCVAYTGAFVKTGLLEKDGRKKFDEIDAAVLNTIDAQRMHNEIPLVENETGKVWYGIDALLEVLGGKMPWIKTIGNIGPVNWFLKKLYKLVSYNRKVIVAVQGKGYDCSPTFSSRYRIIFLLVGLILNSWIFTMTISLANKTIFPASSYSQMQAAHYGVVGINILICLLLGKNKGLEYLGQINMLALLSMLLMLPLISLQDMLPSSLLCAAFGLIGGFIAKEYLRRMKYAQVLEHNKIVVALNVACAVVSFFYLY
jgi:predicted DCC family thiol-disulfide oxidoreductase YuxK